MLCDQTRIEFSLLFLYIRYSTDNVTQKSRFSKTVTNFKTTEKRCIFMIILQNYNWIVSNK